ncbi:short chain dehydrogenase [Burkholderia lata]|uniref:Short chain dehydrogenase n=1 Tax=Burkholderia lata (strain ATCC 17760 / DSM 23089 / LMG 22485 / NCIMB 9086 / R18194 / 383) TaxID=482957 RepID=A0A6P2TE69_BURL3|nr:SDR family oxidoreductase [Burkholderia lata]VWC59263.1 short chain dehydrogenase [Burkholderia lata]
MKQKRILITGAGSGFGREAALQLAARNHHVIAAVYVAPQITELKDEAERRGVTLQIEKLDVTSAHDCERAAQWNVDVLVNNAGAAEAGEISEIPMALVRQLFDVNVFGPLELTQRVVPGMIARGRGRVVFVSSVAGLITAKYAGPYCATKHALEAVAEAMYEELADSGIEVAVINPGPYQTGFNDRMMETPRRWYDAALHRTSPDNMQFPFEQADPADLVARMVDVAEGDGGAFRHLLPAKFEAIVKEFQAGAWTRTQRKQV